MSVLLKVYALRFATSQRISETRAGKEARLGQRTSARRDATHAVRNSHARDRGPRAARSRYLEPLHGAARRRRGRRGPGRGEPLFHCQGRPEAHEATYKSFSGEHAGRTGERRRREELGAKSPSPPGGGARVLRAKGTRV